MLFQVFVSAVVLMNVAGQTTVNKTASSCNATMHVGGFGDIQSPDFPAVKEAYSCSHFFRFPNPNGAVMFNITDISQYYFQGNDKVCSGTFKLGTYDAPCPDATPFCLVYFNDDGCTSTRNQNVWMKYRTCKWYKTRKRTVEMTITSDGNVGEEKTSDSATKWSYPMGVRLKYEFLDCPQDSTTTQIITRSATYTPRTTTMLTQSLKTRSTVSTETATRSSPTSASRESVSSTSKQPPGEYINENLTTDAVKEPQASTRKLTIGEIIVIAVVAFVLVSMIVIIICLIIVKAKKRRKSWSVRLPNVLGREFRNSNGEVSTAA